MFVASIYLSVKRISNSGASRTICRSDRSMALPVYPYPGPGFNSLDRRRYPMSPCQSHNYTIRASQRSRGGTEFIVTYHWLDPP